LQLLDAHGEGFPSAYRERFSADETVLDIARIEEALETGTVGKHLYRTDSCAADEVRLKLYSRDAPLPLSDVLPMLENMGLKVIDEVPHRIVPRKRDHVVYIHDFGLVLRSGAPIGLDDVKIPFEDAFARVWSGETEND